MKVFRSLYDWVLSWANSRYSMPALGLLAFAEASFFPVPPDVLLMAMALSLPTKSYRYALIASLGSVLGGILGYCIGSGFWDMTSQYFYQYVPGINEERFAYVGRWFSQYDFWTVFAAGFTPVPYKIFTIAAGVFKINLPVFVLASLVSRSLRFFLVAMLFFHYGRQARGFIEKYFNTLSLVILGVIVGIIVLVRIFS